jgi:pimeloyl-ACP methyl ester carboxylesterase
MILAVGDGTPLIAELHSHHGPTVVLTHCWNGDRSFWREVLPALTPHYRVVSWDLAGHGASRARRHADWSIANYAADLLRLLDQLQDDQPILVGHSMGGYIALETGLRAAQKPRGVIVIDSLLDVESQRREEQIERLLAPWRDDYRRMVAVWIKTWLFSPSTPASVVDRITTMAVEADPQQSIASIEAVLRYDAAGAFERARFPLAAINADRFPTNLAGNRKYAPQYDAVIMPGVGHYPMLEDPAQFSKLLHQQLERLR